MALQSPALFPGTKIAFTRLPRAPCPVPGPGTRHGAQPSTIELMTRLKFLSLLLMLSVSTPACLGLGVNTSDRSHVGDRRFDHPLNQVMQAAMDALNEMNIMVLGREASGDGQSIQAATFHLDLTIDLLPMEGGQTQVTVYSLDGERKRGESAAKQILDRTERLMLVAYRGEAAWNSDPPAR